MHIGTFYSIKNARFLKKRITQELKNLDSKKLKIKKINNKETQVIVGTKVLTIFIIQRTQKI